MKIIAIGAEVKKDELEKTYGLKLVQWGSSVCLCVTDEKGNHSCLNVLLKFSVCAGKICASLAPVVDNDIPISRDERGRLAIDYRA